MLAIGTREVPRARMKIPIIRGVVRRRLLVNYRVDANVMKSWLPAPFEPMLHRGWAVAGICLIRVEQLPRSLARFGRGLGNENAAHRVAVRWREGETIHEGVYVCTSHTDSLLGQLARGGVLPGEQRRARFRVRDDGGEIGFSMRSADRSVVVELAGHAAAAMPASSIFKSTREASTFFERGAVGYALSQRGAGYEGVEAEAPHWAVHPLSVTHARSSFFDDGTRFPAGSVVFDHALVMRDIEHVWRGLPDLVRERRGPVSHEPVSNR
jgi:hypothetical protein